MKRYDLESTGWDHEEMVERPLGDWCEWDEVDAERAKDKEEIARAFERGVLAMRDAALNAIDAEAIGRISEKLGLGTFEAEEVGQIRNAADKLLAREALEGE